MMRKRLGSIAALCLLVVFLGSCGAAQEQKNKTPVMSFQLQDLDGNLVKSETFLGKKPLLLFFWTTWCPFCQRELKNLNDRYLDLRQEGLEVLAVDVGEPLERVKRFVKNYNLNFPVLLDKDSAVARTYEIIGIPTYILLDKEGRVAAKDNFFPQAKYKELISK
jgi:peroxiredoxin